MKPVILFRVEDLSLEEEHRVACRYFDVLTSRTQIPSNHLVIPRYSALPYYRELEKDVKNLGSELINSYNQHRFIADLVNWTDVLKDYTPRTWTQREIPYLPEDCSFILKGETNSRKFLWDTHMYAKTRSDVTKVMLNLLNDSLISTQSIVVREHVPLKTYMTAFHGLPITKEFRFFVLDSQIVGSGYYWASHIEDLPEVPDPTEVPIIFLKKIMKIIEEQPLAPRFYVLDIGQKETGDWILIEMNDGSQSGLSCVDPDDLYRNMFQTLLTPPL